MAVTRDRRDRAISSLARWRERAGGEGGDSLLRRELRLFLTALQFFTRVPVPAWVGWSPAQLNAAARWFPAVGLCVGAVVGGVYLAASGLWPASVAVLLCMAAGVLLTGAFHEDGFADSCDGLGGGSSREQVLAIMKDSRVGSYALVGMLLLLATKYQALVAVVPGDVPWGEPGGALTWLLLALSTHGASRWSVLWVMARLPYVREDALSKSKPIARGISPGALIWAGCCALLPLAALAWWGSAGVPAVALPRLLLLVAVSWLAGHLAVRVLRRRLGGYVGDALGATQQLSELALLLTWLALVGWH